MHCEYRFIGTSDKIRPSVHCTKIITPPPLPTTTTTPTTDRGDNTTSRDSLFYLDLLAGGSVLLLLSFGLYCWEKEKPPLVMYIKCVAHLSVICWVSEMFEPNKRVGDSAWAVLYLLPNYTDAKSRWTCIMYWLDWRRLFFVQCNDLRNSNTLMKWVTSSSRCASRSLH